jgi:hypothetical protein
LTATTFAREAKEKILPLLQISPYGYGKIKMWKIISSLFIWVLCCLAIAPFFLLSYNIGGITIGELGFIYSFFLGSICIVGVVTLFWICFIQQAELLMGVVSLSCLFFSILYLYFSYPGGTLFHILASL